MDIIKSYKELCQEIEIWKWRVEAYKAEVKALVKLAKADGPQYVKGIDYSQPRSQGTNQIGFEEFLFRLQQLESHILLHVATIDTMTKSKLKIEEHLEKLEGIDRKVVYMRDIEEKPLKDIADELGYSEIYIKKISARNPKEYT